jgi:hypothetical protein
MAVSLEMRPKQKGRPFLEVREIATIRPNSGFIWGIQVKISAQFVPAPTRAGERAPW